MERRLRNSALYIFSVLITLLVMLTVAYAEEDYGVIIGGTRINSTNCSNVFGDTEKTVSYSRDDTYGTATLTLAGAQITGACTDTDGKTAAIYVESGSFPLQIIVVNSATIDLRGESGTCYGIYTENVPLTIQSGSIRGSLTIHMPNGIGIRSGGNFHLNASGLTVDIRMASEEDTCGLWINKGSSFALTWGTLCISGAETPVHAPAPDELSQYVYRGVDGAGEETDITADDLKSNAYDRLILQPIFPDRNLYRYMFGKDRFDTDGDGRLSDTERAAVETLNVSNAVGSASIGIADMAGMRYLPNLKNLYCSRLGMFITELDVSHNPLLEVLHCDYNGLTALDVSNNQNLRELNCECNQLTGLDLSQNENLTYLNCATDVARKNNQITALDLSNCPKLSYLDCRNEPLAVLDISCLPELMYLDCGSCELSQLDVSYNANLQELHARQNAWMTLDMSGCHSLTSLDCSRNKKLTAIVVTGNPQLKALDCSFTLLTALDVSGNPKLQQLDVSSASLTRLDVRGNRKLTELRCSGNQLTELDVSRNMALMLLYCDKNQLSTLDISNNPVLSDLRCYDNRLSRLDISATPIAASESGYTAYVGNQKNESAITVSVPRNREANFVAYLGTATYSNRVVLNPVTLLMGDMDVDGKRTDKDLAELLRYVAGIDTDTHVSRADVNNDKQIDAADVTALAKLIY